MRRSAVPGATGEQGSRNPVEPSERKRKRTPSDARRDAQRAGQQQRREVEAAVHERHLIRSERQPIGWGENRQPILSEDELRAKDWTRPLRASQVTSEITALYDEKRAGA